MKLIYYTYLFYRCRTLQLTIDKLEEYLRKKNANDYQKVGKHETEG